MCLCRVCVVFFFFFQAEDGIRDYKVTGVQTCALPISGYTISGAGGFVGAGASVSVWSIGTTLNKTYSDNSGNSANGVHNDNGDPDSNAAQQSQAGTGVVTQGLGNFSNDGSGNANTNTNRVNSGAQSANSGINAHAPSQSTISNLENGAPVPPGTSAVIHSGADIVTGAAEFSSADVNTSASSTSNNTVQLGTSSGLNTGDKVVYYHGAGGSDIGGLSSGQAYYVTDVGGGLFKLYNSASDANSDLHAITLSSA